MLILKLLFPKKIQTLSFMAAIKFSITRDTPNIIKLKFNQTTGERERESSQERMSSKLLRGREEKSEKTENKAIPG